MLLDFFVHEHLQIVKLVFTDLHGCYSIVRELINDVLAHFLVNDVVALNI